jgi:CHAT domain-containing protein/tetratricopeptide (TPR) repeat protein
MNWRFDRRRKWCFAKINSGSGSCKLFVGTIAFACFFQLIAGVSRAAAGQGQTQSGAGDKDGRPLVLEPGKPLERNLQGGEKQNYEIRAEAGQFVHAEVEQLGIDVQLTIYDPEGKPIASMDSPNGKFGPEKISTIAEAPGIYRLEVSADDKNVPAGRYRVTIDPARLPTDADRERNSAERMFVEAEKLRNQGGEESLRSAMQGFEETLSIWQAAGDAYEKGLTQQTIGGICSALGDKQKALNHYAQALELELSVGDQPGEAVTLASMGEISNDLGEKQKAVNYYTQALAPNRAVRNQAGQAETLNNIGLIYDSLGENQKALDYYTQALPLEHAAGNRAGEGIIFSNIGKIYSGLGENQKALDCFNQALPLVRATGDRTGEAVTLNNIGSVYNALGEKQKALEYYKQVLPLVSAGVNRFGEAVTLVSIGSVYDDLGEKQKALEYYAQALPLQRALGDRRGEGRTFNGIAGVYEQLGEKQKAQEYYAQALPLFRAVADRAGEAAVLTNMGGNYADTGELQRALERLNQALPLRRAVGDRDGEAITLVRIGMAYSASGDFEKALDYFHQALPLERATGDRPWEAVTLSCMGRIYNSLGKKQTALEHYNQALALFLEVRDPLRQVTIADRLMNLWNERSQPETAVFFGKLAVNNIQQIRSNIRGLEKDAQQSFLQSNERVYRKLADILISLGRLSEAEQVLDLLKDEEYFEFVQRDARQAGSLTAPVELTKAESELNCEYEERANRIVATGNEWAELHAKPSRTPEEEKHLSELSERLEKENHGWSEFLNSLHAKLAGLRQVQTALGNVQEPTSQMQRLLRGLGAGTVALYTLASEDKYRVIVVTPNAQVAREYSIKAKELHEKVAALREALLDPGSNPVPKAQELYQILMGPVAKDLEDAQATTLVWSLDSELRYIPLSALHDGQGYLVEIYLNVVFTPGSIAGLAAPPTVGERHGLGVGVSKSYGGMSALPAVPAELHAVIREAGGAESAGVMPGQTMIDEMFTEDNLKAALAQKYQLVHIASHFVFGSGNDTDSYLLLGGKEAGGQRLTLAEINDDPKISFNNVELLTLSACNTVLNIPGDGHEVDGLGMLAQRKGARAVMATLWSVYDPSTSELMQDFYRDWTTGAHVSKGEALRRAQLALLHGGTDRTASATPPPYAHPYYWAPFVLTGNWL